MSKKVKLQHDYVSTLLAPVAVTTTGEIAVALAHEIDAEMGFIVIDRDNDLKEERMFFHRKNANTVFVYSVNRDNPRQHDVGANVILDVLKSVNYAIDTGFPQMYIYKKANDAVIITGGEFFINSERVKIPDFDTSTGNYFTNGVENNVYIKDNQYYITPEDKSDLFLVGKVFVDIAGNVVDIDMPRTQSIGDGMRKEEREKLASINPNEYEKIINKTDDIRAYDDASDTLYPSEKAVAYRLDKKVDKIDGKQLSDQNFEKWEKDFLARLIRLGLEDIDFSKLHNLRQDLRDYYLASATEAVSEKGIAKVLMGYVKTVEGKQLSTNDFTNKYKDIIDSLYKDRNKFVLIDDITQTITASRPSKTKVTSEKAVADFLKGYVEKDGKKTLTDINFTQEIYDEIMSLKNKDKIKVTAGPGISVLDMGPEGYKVSSSIETGSEVIGGNMNIYPLDNAIERYIDEQKYIILNDTQRTGFWGQHTFKNGKNPSIKVFYNNNKGDGKIMIDTHIRIIRSDGSINETHKTFPYEVELKNGHGMFELQPRSFMGLDYSDSEVIYVKVFRVGSYYTDKHGSEFNNVLNDRDTIDGEVRFKSMYLTYETEGEKMFSGTLYDANCKPVAVVEKGMIKTPERSEEDMKGLLSVSTNVSITNGEENRNLEEVDVDEDTVTNWLYTLIKDLTNLGVLRLSAKGQVMSQFNQLKVLNPEDDSLTELDGQTGTVKNIMSFLNTLVNNLNEVFSQSDSENKCTGKKLDIESIDDSKKVSYTIGSFNESRSLDVEIATLEDYRDFVKTLINDVNNSGILTGEIEEVEKFEYEITNAKGLDSIDNNTNTLQDLGNLLFTLIKDIKKSNII